MKIMLIRHFATPGNEKRQYIGSTDEVLSEKTAFLKRSYPIPEYIIASPMKRCVQTAKRIWGTDLSGCPIVLEPLMRECDFGQFEGKTYEQLKKIGLLSSYDEIGKYMWHGGAHHVGYDVHDVVDALGKPIAPNMVFCVDIGIYAEELGIGFRVEDNCLVTPTGAENLSASVPRTIEDIEAVMAK